MVDYRQKQSSVQINLINELYGIRIHGDILMFSPMKFNSVQIIIII